MLRGLLAGGPGRLKPTTALKHLRGKLYSYSRITERQSDPCWGIYCETTWNTGRSTDP